MFQRLVADNKKLPLARERVNIIQLMHSFEVNIRICQPENITVLGLTNPDVNLKRMHQLYNVTWARFSSIYF